MRRRRPVRLLEAWTEQMAQWVPQWSPAVVQRFFAETRTRARAHR